MKMLIQGQMITYFYCFFDHFLLRLSIHMYLFLFPSSHSFPSTHPSQILIDCASIPTDWTCQHSMRSLHRALPEVYISIHSAFQLHCIWLILYLTSSLAPHYLCYQAFAYLAPSAVKLRNICFVVMHSNNLAALSSLWSHFPQNN